MEIDGKDKAWLELYREAILEHDPGMLMNRLRLARKGIQERKRDLWYAKSPDSERERLTAAAYYLEILRSLAETRSGGIA